MIVCRSAAELERLARVNALVARVLAELRTMVAPGVTTAEIDARAEQRLREAGAEPAFKGYNGYPSTICASVNEQVVHGFPSARQLVEGDIVSVDLGAKLDGYFGDSAVTVPVGQVSAEAARLLEVTAQALNEGLAVVKAGARLSDIGAAVQRHVEAHGFSVVREFVGHGIGTALHEEPQIPNYGTPGRGPAAGRGHGPGDRADGERRPAGREGVERRVDGRHQGRQSVGALRAHGRGHRGRVPGADAGRTPPPTWRREAWRARGGRRSPLEVEGVVRELLPSALVRVSIEGRHDVVAHPGGSPSRNYVRVVVGDRVRLTLSPTDRTRGRIVEKL